MWSSHFPSGTPSRFSLAFGLTTMVFKISNTDPDHLSTLTLGILCLVSRLFLVYLCWWVPPCLSTSSLLNMLFPSFPALVSPSPTQSFSLTSHSSGGSGPISSPPGEWGVAKAVYVSPIISVTRMNSKCWFVRFLSPYMTALLESKKDNMLLLQHLVTRTCSHAWVREHSGSLDQTCVLLILILPTPSPVPPWVVSNKCLLNGRFLEICCRMASLPWVCKYS